MKSLLTWTERRLLRLFRKLSNRQNFHLKAEMFSFHSKYFVYRELKRAPQKLSFCFKCPDTGTVRILGNILYFISSNLMPISMLYFKLSSIPVRDVSMILHRLPSMASSLSQVKFTITTPDPLLLIIFIGNTLD